MMALVRVGAIAWLLAILALFGVETDRKEGQEGNSVPPNAPLTPSISPEDLVMAIERVATDTLSLRSHRSETIGGSISRMVATISIGDNSYERIEVPDTSDFVERRRIDGVFYTRVDGQWLESPHPFDVQTYSEFHERRSSWTEQWYGVDFISLKGLKVWTSPDGYRLTAELPIDVKLGDLVGTVTEPTREYLANVLPNEMQVYVEVSPQFYVTHVKINYEWGFEAGEIESFFGDHNEVHSLPE